jgi:hypothetical protein
MARFIETQSPFLHLTLGVQGLLLRFLVGEF